MSFTVHTRYPVPYLRCYCGICRKCGGGGGYLINMLADARTLVVRGQDHVRVYRARIQRGGEDVVSKHERHFCGDCGTHLWAFHPQWPALLHPVAGAIDTPLPRPPHTTAMMLGSAASWADADAAPPAEHYEGYPSQSLKGWHETHDLALPPTEGQPEP